jgi:hypothetical protein
VVVLGLGTFLWRWNSELVANNPENKCRASGGGWAPLGPAGYRPESCDGTEMKNVPELVDREGFTCWCHSENTCWDGESCVPINTAGEEETE